jgi:hypothetical protein
MDLDELLDLLQSNSLVVIISSLLVYLIVITRRDSFVVVIAASCVVAVAHQFYDAALVEMAKDESNRALVRDLWYLGFAASDFLLVLACYKILEKLSLRPNKVTTFYLNCYLFLGFIQLIRYADRILIKTDFLGPAYQLAIPAINSSMVIITVAYVGYSISYKIKKEIF